MKKIAERHPQENQQFLLFHSLYLLAGSDSEKLSWPNSPLLVLLQLVDPSAQSGDLENSITPLHHLAFLADPTDYSTLVNQVILAKQLIERGADVNAVSSLKGETTFHEACFSHNVTNLDFVELLLEAGADPNSQDCLGLTPLMYTIPHAPGAAKYLLNWSTTDINITTRSGHSFLDRVKRVVEKVALPDHPERVQNKFLLRQWRKIEKMLVKKGGS
jgi:hypothetical protein